MADIQIADDKLDELFMEWRSQRTAASMRAFVDGMNAIIEDRGNVARQRNEALMRLDALLASTAQRQGCREMKPDWYTANDWSKLPAGGNSLRQIFVRLEDWEAVLAESERALSVCSKGFDAMCKRALAAEARIRDLEAALREIARRESEAREIVTQNRWPSTLAIDLASQARLALEPPVSKSQQKRIDALTAPETTGEPK